MLVELRQEAACEFAPADRRGVGTEAVWSWGLRPASRQARPTAQPLRLRAMSLGSTGMCGGGGLDCRKATGRPRMTHPTEKDLQPMAKARRCRLQLIGAPPHPEVLFEWLCADGGCGGRTGRQAPGRLRTLDSGVPGAAPPLCQAPSLPGRPRVP